MSGPGVVLFYISLFTIPFIVVAILDRLRYRRMRNLLIDILATRSDWTRPEDLADFLPIGHFWKWRVNNILGPAVADGRVEFDGSRFRAARKDQR